MDIKVTSMTIPGSPVGGENPLPVFRARQHDIQPGIVEPFPEEKKEKFGYETGFRILPYRIQDRYSRKRRPLQFKCITMENDYLKASFLPEVGGKLYSLVDKKTGRELLSRNPVFQPANLAIRNAWTSGGIEWNISQTGHTFHTCSSVFASVVAGKNGERFLRLYEFERCKRLFWQIDFHLPDDSGLLYAYVKVVNPNGTDTPMYWWTNIAVPQTPEARVFASADDVIHMGFGYARMPVLPSLPGKDFSYPLNSTFANEYFFQCPEQKMPWEASVYKDGDAFFEVSTARLRYRKMFCWGNHAGGMNWQKYLAEPGIQYIEIQAGLAPTQLHGLDMPGKAVWDWTQAFGGMDADSIKAHDADWFAARKHVEGKIKEIIREEELYGMEEAFREDADNKPLSTLHTGSGWGALECERMRREKEAGVPDGLDFPLSTIGEEQYPWLCLLQNGTLPERDPDGLPGAWMIQREWNDLLSSSIGKTDKKENRNWYALLHAGVMAFEEGDEGKAVELWQESVKTKPSIWAYRNLAAAAQLKQDMDTALDYMKKAWESSVVCPDQALAEEYLSMLIGFRMHKEAWNIYESLPGTMQSTERVSLLAGTAAIEFGNLEYVRCLFDHEYAVIREGEVLLSDLWFKYHAAILAKERGVEVTPELIEEVTKNCPPPSNLDFRMSGQ